MALTAYPFDAQTVSETQYGDLVGAVAQSGIIGAPGTNHFLVSAPGGSMSLTVTAVGGASRALVRGAAVLMTANYTVTVATADTTARADLVVLQLDYTANSITPVVKKGTAGSSTPPSPAWGAGGFYEIPLAVIAVAGNTTSISAGNVTDVRRWTGPTVGVWTTASRPTAPLSFGLNTTTGGWEFTSDGTTWAGVGTVDLASAQVTGTLPAARGGTGQVTLNATRNALGLGNDTTQPVPVANGGTGATTRDAARQGGAIDLWLQSSAPAHSAGRLWLKTA